MIVFQALYCNVSLSFPAVYQRKQFHLRIVSPP